MLQGNEEVQQQLQAAKQQAEQVQQQFQEQQQQAAERLQAAEEVLTLLNCGTLALSLTPYAYTFVCTVNRFRAHPRC